MRSGLEWIELVLWWLCVYYTSPLSCVCVHAWCVCGVCVCVCITSFVCEQSLAGMCVCMVCVCVVCMHHLLCVRAELGRYVCVSLETLTWADHEVSQTNKAVQCLHRIIVSSHNPVRKHLSTTACSSQVLYTYSRPGSNRVYAVQFTIYC